MGLSPLAPAGRQRIDEQEWKRCTDCGDLKPLLRFHRKRVGRNGEQQYQAYCKDCGRQRSKKYSAENKDALRYKDRARYFARKRRYRRLYLYGVTSEQFDAMLVAQEFACAVCRLLFEDPEAAGVDHDHQTGVVRGLLCDLCNRAAGYLKDDPVRASSLALYLEAGGFRHDA